jgi:hypothetical protein
MKITKNQLKKLVKATILKEVVTQRGIHKELQGFIDQHGNEFFCARGANAEIGRKDFGGVMHGKEGFISGNIGNIEMIKREKPIMLPIINPVTGKPVFKDGKPAKFPYFPVSKHLANGPVFASGRPYAIYYDAGDDDYVITVRPNIVNQAKSNGLKVTTIGDGGGLWVRSSDWNKLTQPRAPRRYGNLFIRLEMEIANVLKANQNISTEYSHRDAVDRLSKALINN